MLKKLTVMLSMLLIAFSINSAEPANNKNRKVIIFNGASCAGKTTIATTFKTITPYFANKWQFISQDDNDLDDFSPVDSNILENFDHRAMLGKILKTKDSYICCDLILHQNIEIEEFLRLLQENNFIPIIVLIDCPRNILHNRAYSRSLDRSSSEGETATTNKALNDWDELHEKDESTLNTPNSLSDRRFSISETYSDIEPELININADSEISKPKYENYTLIIDTSKEQTATSIKRILDLI